MLVLVHFNDEPTRRPVCVERQSDRAAGLRTCVSERPREALFTDGLLSKQLLQQLNHVVGDASHGRTCCRTTGAFATDVSPVRRRRTERSAALCARLACRVRSRVVPAALYFPYSRCLDMTALKQALLLYDELLFVDSVDPYARADLYLREAQVAGVDPTITRRWAEAEDAYELLMRNGVASTVFSDVLQDPEAADALAASNLTIDVERNRASRFFPGLHRWQMLGDRMPQTVLDRRYDTRRAVHWSGFTIFEVPYTVGASIATTYATAIAHELGVVPMTDSVGCHLLLVSRLQSAASVEGNLPGLHAAPRSPYLRRQIEVRLVDELAPAEALRTMSVDEVLRYREETKAARRELAGYIDSLVDRAHHQPWDAGLDMELDELSRQARELAAQPGRWGAAAQAAKPHVDPGALAAGAVTLAAPTTVTAVVAPHVSLIGALAVGGAAVLSQGTKALSAAVSALLAKRPAEQNAVSYLLNARPR